MGHLHDISCRLRLHRRQHKREGREALEAPSWRFDSMSTAREEARWPTEMAQAQMAQMAQMADEFLEPEAAEYLAPSSSGYTLASLLDGKVSKVSVRRRKPGRACSCPVCGEAFAEHALPSHVEECLERAEAEAEREMESMELPEELLESFLQLDLGPVASEVFWCTYETSRKRGVHAAFLSALEEAISVEPEAWRTCVAWMRNMPTFDLETQSHKMK